MKGCDKLKHTPEIREPVAEPETPKYKYGAKVRKRTGSGQKSEHGNKQNNPK